MLHHKIFFVFVFFFLVTSSAFAEHEGEMGYCVLCNTKIMDGVDKYLKPNQEYTEIWFEFSNDSIGKIGFCKKHALSLTKEDYLAIVKGLHNGWNKEFKVNRWTKKQIQEYTMDFFTLTIRRRLDEKEIPAGS